MESVRKLYRARKTVSEMLHDRGYEIDTPLDIDFEEFKVLHHTDNIDIHIINSEREIYIKFITTQKTKPNIPIAGKALKTL